MLVLASQRMMLSRGERITGVYRRVEASDKIAHVQHLGTL